ncbi:MAG: orotate phosphoribosyltransferase [Candidatus Marinimicrobia bacterium]|jgi:orotate phosphoribosyltransferase|nr:orotate phosphoribosyltransferase [Candidatus Neomarinimicrobiota bacterium]MDD5709405.1 orotate phosphoribosyltransferase [Candidatus Neomarinimicrobiota bacterium]MDX9777283.1 orotate phosphoribosyltransferase [bacterium]
MREDSKDIARQIAAAAIRIKAVKLQPDNPFTWASGYKMPIYNDNRLFLFYPEYRSLICSGFAALIRERDIKADIIAGTPTAGIPHGILLAERLGKPFIYPRKSQKDHGMQNKIEGIPDTSLLKGKRVLMIEDLISTGGSSLEALETLRGAGADVDTCLSIFSYGFQKAEDCFHQAGAEYISLLTFDILLEVVEASAYFNKTQIELLRAWQLSPFEWGERFSKEG